MGAYRGTENPGGPMSDPDAPEQRPKSDHVPPFLGPISKPVWPDKDATVSEMQSARWYLTAVMSPDDVKLGDVSKGEVHKIECTPKRAIAALELALSHAEQFRKCAWREVDRLKADADRLAKVGAEICDERDKAQRRAAELRGEVERLKKGGK